MSGWVLLFIVCWGTAGVLFTISAVDTRRQRRADEEARRGHPASTGELVLELDEPTVTLAILPAVRGPREPTRMISQDEYHQTLLLADQLAWTQFVNNERWAWGQLMVWFEASMSWPELLRYGAELASR